MEAIMPSKSAACHGRQLNALPQQLLFSIYCVCTPARTTAIMVKHESMLYCTLHCSQLLLGSSGVGDLSQICSRAGLDGTGDHQYIHALLIKRMCPWRTRAAIFVIFFYRRVLELSCTWVTVYA